MPVYIVGKDAGRFVVRDVVVGGALRDNDQWRLCLSVLQWCMESNWNDCRIFFSSGLSFRRREPAHHLSWNVSRMAIDYSNLRRDDFFDFFLKSN